MGILNLGANAAQINANNQAQSKGGGILSTIGHVVASGFGLPALGNDIYQATHQPTQTAVDTSAAGTAARTAAAQQAASQAAAASGGSSYAQQAAANTAAQQAAAAAAINAGYGQVLGQYDNDLAALPGQIAAAQGLVGSQYDAQRGSIDTQYGIGNSNLQYARNDLNTKTTRSIRDLAQGIRDSFDSYSNMIGAGGGGDSSANGQLSYALQKAEAQNRTNIYNGEQDQMGQITQQQSALDANHADQIKQLDAWKAQQVITIGQQFQAQQQAIEDAKAGASKDKLLALANLNTDLVNQAVQALSGVEAQHQAATAAITQQLQAGVPTNNSASLGATNYTVAAPAAPTLPGYSTSADDGDSFLSAVPASYLKKLQSGT